MNSPLMTMTTVIALAVAAGTAIYVVRDRQPGRLLFGALATLEVALLVVAVVGLVQLATTDRDVDRLPLGAYLVTMLLLVPAATLWARVERTRFGTAIIILACLAVPVMTSRAQEIWAAGHVG